MYVYIQYILITGLITFWTKYNINCMRREKATAKVKWFFEWLFFTIFAACRLVDGTVGGADSENYVYAFLNKRIESSEPLLYKLNDFVLSFTHNYHIYLFVIYGIIVFGLLYFAAYAFNRENTNILILLFYFNIYVTSFGVLRQWVAVSIGLIAVVLLSKGKPGLSILFAVISTGFHFTMAAYLGLIIFYILAKKLWKKIPDAALLLGALGFNALSVMLQGEFISYLAHTEYKAYVSSSIRESASWLGYIPTIFFLILCFLYSRYIANSNELDQITRLFLFANLGLIYMTVALGMFRFQLIFMPIRAYAMYKVREGICKRIVLGNRRMNRIAIIFDCCLLFDVILYMWRTIGNGALPYVFDISSRFTHIPYYIK